MSRGIGRRGIFGDEREHEHFVDLLGEMVKRFGVKVHAFVLMGNHYHLLVQTPHANLSRAMQWLNVSYGVWYNRRNEWVGPLFQGRFKAVPIDGEGSWVLLASEYLHLNPVRVKGLGLGKHGRKAEGGGIAPPPTPELVKARLETLRGHRWSSYLAYAGYAPRPSWLTCDDLWQRARRTKDEKPELAYRWQVEAPLQTGIREELETFGERCKGALAVGSTVFIERLRRLVRGDRRTQPAVRRWQRLLPFTRAIKTVAAAKGESWERFRNRHGDDGRDTVLWLGRRHCGLTLLELGAAAGGLSAAAVGAAVRRIENRRNQDAKFCTRTNGLERHLLESET
jgi:REP element-mobilizing transposase RayT